MRQNILFIIPPHITFSDFISPTTAHKQVKKKDGNIYGNFITDMPLGILALSAYIKKNADVDVKLIDFNVELNNAQAFNFDSYLDYFQKYLFYGQNNGWTPDIIGVSALFSPSYEAMLDIFTVCRGIYSNAFIIAGGNIPSTMPGEIFRASECLDAICYGEGEKPLIQLLQTKDRENYINNSASWITKQKMIDQTAFPPRHDFIADLDEIPIYDYGLVGDKYSANPAFTTYGGIQEKTASFHILTSRGCPFKCVFCASHKVHGRKMRYYSIDRVKQDLLYLKHAYHVKTLIFQDDHFMGDKKRALEIVQLVNEIGATAIFQNSLALYALDKEMLVALKEAGMNQLVLSVESGSDRVLRKVMRKPLKLSIVKQVAQDCRDLGIYTYANILIGLPGETKDDIEDSRRFLKTIGANWFGVFCANPLVGSEMFEICMKNDYLKHDWIGSDYKKAVVETKDWSSDYIQSTAYELNLELNFVYNSDCQLGNYEQALDGFLRAIRAKDDHAFAYYYAAQCYQKLGLDDKYGTCARKYNEYAKIPFWSALTKKYGMQPNLPLKLQDRTITQQHSHSVKLAHTLIAQACDHATTHPAIR